MGRPEFFADNNLFQPQHVDKLIRMWGDLTANEFRSNRHEIMGMIVAYLTHLGCLDQAIAANPKVPFSAQLRQDEYVGPVFGEMEAGQVFVAKRPIVSRVGFVAATYMRTNTQDVRITIEDEERKIAEIAANSAQFKDNGWVILDIPPASIEVGREYRLKVRSPQSTPTNAIAVRYSPEGTGFTFAGITRPGQMAHMLF